jgi:cobalt/nickel transport system ATP-binding protein
MNDDAPVKDAAPAPPVAVENLHYEYPGGGFALQDVSFRIEAGEIVGLVGPSGAGKSTLLMHLNGLLPESSPARDGDARVRIHGTAVTKAALQQIRREVGFLFQDPDDQLFCPTVREDVAFGPLNSGLSQDEARRRMQAALRQVGLEAFEQRSTIQLSLGERRRVCLAGVLACEPRVLVLDEPFSNLDPRSRNQLTEILQRFAGAQNVATHDLDLVATLCRRVIVIDGGLIRAEGPAEQILRDRELMHRHGLEVPWRWRTPVSYGGENSDLARSPKNE